MIAVTPLLDERSIAALLDLRARGHDLAIVEVSPEDIVTPGDGLDALAYRLWLLRRAGLRAPLRALRGRRGALGRRPTPSTQGSRG